MTFLPTLFSRDRSSVDLFNDMNDFFRQMTRGSNFDALSAIKVDVQETATEYLVEADLPKVKKENVKATLRKNLLTIQTEESKEDEKKDKEFFIRERVATSACRTIELPFADDSKELTASFHNGTLSLKVPKVAERHTDKIKIQ